MVERVRWGLKRRKGIWSFERSGDPAVIILTEDEVCEEGGGDPRSRRMCRERKEEERGIQRREVRSGQVRADVFYCIVDVCCFGFLVSGALCMYL